MSQKQQPQHQSSILKQWVDYFKKENNAVNAVPFRETEASKEFTEKLLITHTKDWFHVLSEFVLIFGAVAALGYFYQHALKQFKNQDSKSKKNTLEFKRLIIRNLVENGRKITNFDTTVKHSPNPKFFVVRFYFRCLFILYL